MDNKNNLSSSQSSYPNINDGGKRLCKISVKP